MSMLDKLLSRVKPSEERENRLHSSDVIRVMLMQANAALERDD